MRSHPRGARIVPWLLACVLTAAAGGLTIAGFLARSTWHFELATSFRPHYAVALVLAAIGFVALRRWWGASVAVLLAAVNLVLVVPPLVGGRPDIGAGTPILTILTHNLHGGGAARQEQIVSALGSHPADLAFFLAHQP